MSPNNILELYKICIENTYFVFNLKVYKQIYGLAIGASMSGFAAEIYMENYERKAINTFVKPPTLWKRYVDDTFVKIEIKYVKDFLIHLNSIHPRIQFTHEEIKNNIISFLDIEINVKEDGSIKFKIYRKNTHTDQYLNFESNHHISQKLGIINTFQHRINNIITDEEDKTEERKRVKNKLKNCKYPEWSFNRKKRKSNVQKERRPTVSIPYIKNTSEKIARAYRKYGIDVVHKPSATIKNRLCHLKDKVHKMEKPGPLYKISCKKHPDDKYVGETERAMKFRAYEHKMIEHKEVLKSWSLEEEIEIENEDKEEENQRKSERLKEKKKINYVNMNNGRKEEENR